MALRNRVIFWACIGIALIAMAIWAFSPRPVEVDLASAVRGEMNVAVREEGEARIHDVFEISAPVAGRLERIELEAGDCVYQGKTVVGVIRPMTAPILDTRSEERLRAVADAASAAVGAADAELERVRTELTRVSADSVRYRKLAETGTVSMQAVERIEADEATLKASERAAEAALAMRRQELAAARAALRPSGAGVEGELLDVVAPIDGVVLRRLRQSEGPVVQGAALVEVGDPDEIEIVADLLSEDAVRITPGDRVVISDWGGPDLEGRVRRIEPFAFTKVSALGIEEQRANIVIDLTADQPAARLGHGYRVDVAVEAWSADDVLKAPMTAIFKQDQAWSVYRVERGRARLRQIDLGQMNGREAQVLSGLEAGDLLVEHPSSRIEDGVRVKQRSQPDEIEADQESVPTAVTTSFDEQKGGCDASFNTIAARGRP